MDREHSFTVEDRAELLDAALEIEACAALSGRVALAVHRVAVRSLDLWTRSALRLSARWSEPTAREGALLLLDIAVSMASVAALRVLIGDHDHGDDGDKEDIPTPCPYVRAVA